jgi:chromosome segregation ATPase
VAYIRAGRLYCDLACAEWQGADRRQEGRLEPPSATAPEGEATMTSVESKEARDQAGRWLDDGQRLLNVLLTVVNDYDRLNDRVEAAEHENERLRGLIYENEQLRHRLEAAERERDRLLDEMARRMAELERGQREREEIADRLSQFVNDVMLRLRSQQHS